MKMTLKRNSKAWFFDKLKVIRAMDRATAKALSKAGAYIRTTARGSMRRRKGPSKPGKPPNAHVGLLKDRLFFAYEPRNKGVVVGPEALGSEAEVPQLTEEGGTKTAKATRVIKGRLGRGSGGRFTSEKFVLEKGSRVVYPARPYMGPALEKNLDVIPQAYSNTLK